MGCVKPERLLQPVVSCGSGGVNGARVLWTAILVGNTGREWHVHCWCDGAQYRGARSVSIRSEQVLRFFKSDYVLVFRGFRMPD